jgi:hypothetical protein
MTLSLSEAQALEADVNELEALIRQYPLAGRVLWEAPHAECDQRRAYAGALLSPLYGFVTGGNRSGKTTGLLDTICAMALGSDHPAVRAWLTANGLPDVIPPGPAEVFLVAQSSNDSLRYHRAAIDDRLGTGPECTWYNRNGKGEAFLRIKVPNYEKPAIIWFKSLDQERKSFQGTTLRCVGIDEEPTSEESKGILEECEFRVADQAGWILVAMSPLSGLTWVYHKHIKKVPADTRVFRLDTLENKHIDRKYFENKFAGMSKELVAMRRFGEFTSRDGKIYQFSTLLHVCDPFEIPPEWPRYRCADFGLRLPTCVLWFAVGPDDTLWFFREYYATGRTWAQHAQAVAAIEAEPGFGDVFGGWGDPAGGGSRSGDTTAAIPTFAEHGILFSCGENAVRTGIDAVAERLRAQDDGKPRLVFFRGCEMAITQVEAYRWDDRRKDEVPLKVDDHAADAVRYGVMGARRIKGY